MDRSGFNGCFNRAAFGFGVRTVAELAVSFECDDFIKSVLNACAGIQMPQFAHAGRIDHQRSIFEHNQFPPGGCVDPFAVAFPHGQGEIQILFAEQTVDQRGFSDTRRAEQTIGFSDSE